MTNHHVISTNEIAEKAKIYFGYDGYLPDKFYKLRPDILFKKDEVNLFFQMFFHTLILVYFKTDLDKYKTKIIPVFTSIHHTLSMKPDPSAQKNACLKNLHERSINTRQSLSLL